MEAKQKQRPEPQIAVFYGRVSSVKQTVEGSGLTSQETRCRQFAQHKGYDVVEVFTDDLSGSLTARPGMDAMLCWIRQNRALSPIVLIDDISRLARGLEAHLKLRAEIDAAGGRLESPSIEFGEDSDSLLVENLLASVAQHQREKNGEQVRNRMRARITSGYWCFKAPVGYRYERVAGHGNLLVRDEPLASIIQEALEGYAEGRFSSQAEVKRFLEAQPEYPKDLPNGEIRMQRVSELLSRSTYAGYIEVPRWGITLRKGHHEGLIDLPTWQKIQDRREARNLKPFRKDIAEDFPMRGYVNCADCDNPMTSCWSKGSKKRYAYYLCDTKGCVSYRKSIPRSQIEEGFSDILKTLQPNKSLIDVAKAMFRDLWDARLANARACERALQRQLDDVIKQSDALLERIVEATSAPVIAAYEKKIEKLEREKLVLAEKLANLEPPTGRFEQTFELAWAFLSNPWKIWDFDNLTLRRTVLKLAFSKPLTYDRNEGYRTPITSLPFKALGEFEDSLCKMVRSRRLELPRVLPHSDLNAARLPIPPRPHCPSLVTGLLAKCPLWLKAQNLASGAHAQAYLHRTHDLSPCDGSPVLLPLGNDPVGPAWLSRWSSGSDPPG